MRTAFQILTLFVVASLACSCAERDKKGRLVDTPTAGTISISADESLRPFVEAEVNEFMGIYQQAKINVQYLSEGEAIDALLKDSVRLAIVTRKLSEDENQRILLEKIIPTQVPIATGAVALIANLTNADTLLTVDQLEGILTGKVSDWKQINPSGKARPIEMIFDSPTSGIVRYLNDTVARVASLPANFYAASSNARVIDYVRQRPGAIGLIGVEWISDHDDSVSRGFLKSVSVMSVAEDEDYYKPFQAFIATRQYPLSRSVVVISREARAGLGSGLMAFIAGDKGQRIVLKAGLVPATMPVRIVDINQ